MMFMEDLVLEHERKLRQCEVDYLLCDISDEMEREMLIAGCDEVSDS